MKNDKHEQARNLFFETDLNQGQIADLVCVARKTMSQWATEGQWRRLKQAENELPAVAVESMFTEIAEINKAIRSRPPGKRFPTMQEAEIRRKILASIRCVKEHESLGSNIEVMKNFLTYVKSRLNLSKENELNDLKHINSYADAYLRAEVFPNPDRAHHTLYTFHTPPEETEEPEDETPPQESEPEYQERWSKVVDKFRKENNTKKDKQINPA